MRVLILGGSSEASRLAARLVGDSDFEPILSLAGRTKNPAPSPIPCRIGGFGGADGLAAYLEAEAIDVLVDATHPFAERMSANAVAAARQTKTPLIVFTRPPWTPEAGDRWTEWEDASAAAGAIGQTQRRVFLTVGRLHIPAFEAAPQHTYLIRAIDPPEPAPNFPHYRLLLARGPFAIADEIELMRAERIEVLVTKNSGGEAAAAKLAAARALAVEVILLRPPRPPNAPIYYTLESVMDILKARLHR